MPRRGSFFATLLIVCTAVAFSQDGRGPGRGGFFIMGPGGRASGPGLLGMPEVQRELSLSEDQVKQVGDVLNEQREQMRTLFANADQVDPADARRGMELAAQKAEEKLSGMLNTRQRARLNQLQLQRQGAAALGRAEIARQLSLTDEQNERLSKLLESSRPREGFGPPDRGPNLSDALAILTAEQNSKWKEIIGAEFKFPEGPQGFGPPGLGGPGGPMGGERKLVTQFDKNDDGWLNVEERKAAREAAPAQRGPGGRGPGGPGGGSPGGFGPPGGGPPGGPGRNNREPAKPGPRISTADVAPVSDASLYDPGVLRTLFLEFESPDWEAELADFKSTDVEVPATLTVDGKKYRQVGVQFRGASSYMNIPAGYKRSLNLSVDLVDSKQRLYGYKTLNLLNANDDASFMSTVLYSHIARQYIPAPKANFVRVVINGESWGVYVNVQQFNKEFLAENYNSTKGARWKVSGNPGGGGGLEYQGDDIANYKRRYEIKSSDDDKSWKALIRLCKTLNETPTDQLEEALRPMLDLDGLLWFLALDVALINNDGYWIRASDYSLYLDEKGKFHIVPHDMNEAFHPGGGPGFGGPGGPGGRPGGLAQPGAGPGGPRGAAAGLEIDPLIGLDDVRKPLRSKILAVPSLRAKYLENVRTIARDWLDWNKLGTVVGEYRKLIASEVEADTRKLSTFEAFQRSTANEAGPGRGRELPLRTFAEQRRNYLLNHAAISRAD